MAKAVEHAREEFAAIRTGRAHPSMFAKITAEYYGQQTPLQQLAGFQVPEPRLVVISPYDASAKSAIEKAIRESDLGVNPTDDGKVLRVVLPELTEERRKEYIKLAKTKAEDGKVAVRNVRRNAKQALDQAEKDSEISKDETTGAEKRLDGLTRSTSTRSTSCSRTKKLSSLRSEDSSPVPTDGSHEAPREAERRAEPGATCRPRSVSASGSSPWSSRRCSWSRTPSSPSSPSPSASASGS